MKVRVIPGRELTCEQAMLWSRLQDENPLLVSPYFCPQFTRAVASVRQDVFVAVMEDSEGVGGFFPFQRGPLRMGRPVGGAMSDCHGAIARATLRWRGEDLIRQCGLSLWDFDHLLAEQESFAPYHRVRSESPYMDLSEGYEAYAAARRASGSEQVKKAGNLMRRLEREIGPVRFEAHEADLGALRRLLGWKSAQYAQAGIRNPFGVRWTVALLDELMEIREEGFAGMLSTLRAGGRMIAAHFGMRSRRQWHYWFPAYDSEFHRFSPGLILLLKIAEYASARGIRRIDLGKGDSAYKQRLSNGSTPLAEGSIHVPSLASAARAIGVKAERWAQGTVLEPVARMGRKAAGRISQHLRFR